ncbi:MAG: hypothetical protein ACLR7Z_11710 [Bilophila wadsworthia]
MKGFNPNCPEVYGNPDPCAEDLHRPQGHVRSLHVEPLAARPWPERRDVNIVDMQPSEAMKAFADGQGDAIAVGPQTFEAEKLGLKTVAHSSDCNARHSSCSSPIWIMPTSTRATSWPSSACISAAWT